MERLGEMLVEMRHAPDPRLLLEVALVQLTHDAAGADLHSLMSRLERLEQTVAAGARRPRRPSPCPPIRPPGGPPSVGAPAARRRRPGRHTAGATDRGHHIEHARSPTRPPAVADRHLATAAAPIDDGEIPSLFEKQVRPALRGMTKAIYMGAHVGTMSGGALVISFAGEPHRVRAEEYRQEVERALAMAAGRPIPLSLVVDHAVAHDDNVVPLKRAELAPADEDVDTGDLVDVPPEAVVSPIDRLTQAFPGSEIIEERT